MSPISIEKMPNFPDDVEPIDRESDMTDRVEDDEFETFSANIKNIPPMEEPSGIPMFVLSLFQIADQAKMIHLQTDSDTEHRHFGMFYDTFVGFVDVLVEAIAGKYGTQTIKFGHASIVISDCDLAVPTFFEIVERVLKSDFAELFDREKDSELFNIIDEMMTLKNKVQYLLQMKRN